jgi:hypothetical protein
VKEEIPINTSHSAFNLVFDPKKQKQKQKSENFHSSHPTEAKARGLKGICASFGNCF